MDQHRPPIGFRFYPTEEELISFYLHHKLRGTGPDLNRIIPVVDIYGYNPHDLPGLAGELYGQQSEQWFFFVPRQEREARGGRPNRLTNHGYWKATGSPCDVYSSQNRKIGRKRTMVFYTGRAPNGKKTVWTMNEYKANIVDRGDVVVVRSSSMGESSPHQQLREELSLCRIYKRSKCLRSAFDRRPRLDQQPRDCNILAKPYFHHGNDYAATVHDYAITANPRRLSTPQNLTTVTTHENSYSMEGSSSVNDHRFDAHNSLCVGTVPGPTDTSLWGWEHELNWFNDI